MAYRRIFQPNRKYSQPSTNQAPSTDSNFSTLKPIVQIPLPNEAEETHSPVDNSKRSRKPFSLDSIVKNIQIEELLLLGLIFLLFAEGLEDDILIILLVYILITGRA